MQLPAYNHNIARWDSLKRFYNSYALHYSDWHEPLYRLDTGEMFILATRWTPAKRREYAEYGFTIMGTDDYDCRALYDAEGNQLTRAWLTARDGMQVLLLDHATQLVTYIGWSRTKDREPAEWDTIPRDLRQKQSIVLWCAGDGERPIGRKVAVSKPTVLDPAAREHARDLRHASRAWLEMLDPSARPRSRNNSHRPLHFTNHGAKSFGDLLPDERLRLATRGWIWPRTTTYHQYLYTSEEGANGHTK